MRRPACVGRWALAAALLAGCRGTGPTVAVFEGSTMGTSYTVKVAVAGGLDEAGKDRLHGLIDAALADVDARMSTYRGDSEVSRFNRFGETTPFAVSVETAEVVALALDVSQKSGGALDVTVGPLVNAWGFGPGREEATVPDDATIEALRARTGWQRLSADVQVGTLTKSHPDLAIDLSSVAKGYAVDRVAAALQTSGVADFMVEVGGEIRAGGRNGEGAVWQIGVERPDPAHPGLERVLPLENGGMATSGDYRNYREVGGRRFSHIIDPRTGRPIGHRVASSTVIDPRCAVADAWATAMMVLGPEEGVRVAEEQALSVLLVAREGEGFSERPSSAFARRFPSS